MEKIERSILKKVLLIDEERVIDKILQISKKTTFEKNQMILNIGEKQENVYIIISGIARSFYLDIDGNDITKMFMKENDFCVGESLFEEGNSIQGFEALEEIRALKINAKELKQIIMSNKKMIETYMNYLEQNLIYKMQRESSFQIMSATERYLHFHKKYKEIEKRVNSSYIASYLGITPESLSRIKRYIKEEN